MVGFNLIRTNSTMDIDSSLEAHLNAGDIASSSQLRATQHVDFNECIQVEVTPDPSQPTIDDSECDESVINQLADWESHSYSQTRMSELYDLSESSRCSTPVPTQPVQFDADHPTTSASATNGAQPLAKEDTKMSVDSSASQRELRQSESNESALTAHALFEQRLGNTLAQMEHKEEGFYHRLEGMLFQVQQKQLGAMLVLREQLTQDIRAVAYELAQLRVDVQELRRQFEFEWRRP